MTEPQAAPPGAPIDVPSTEVPPDDGGFTEVGETPEVVATVTALPATYTGGADSAIEAAANAALEEPGIPGRSEFMAMAQMARILSMCDLAPQPLRGKPANEGKNVGLPTQEAPAVPEPEPADK